MSEDIKGWLILAVTVVLLVGTIAGSITWYAISSDRQLSRRIESACRGDLNSDVSRAVACISAVHQSR